MKTKTHAGPCDCNDTLIFADEPHHCHRCGHGPLQTPPAKRPLAMRRLPRDLGAIQRAGRRPDPNLENVVQLDRIRRPQPPRLAQVVQLRPRTHGQEERAAA